LRGVAERLHRIVGLRYAHPTYTPGGRMLNSPGKWTALTAIEFLIAMTCCAQAQPAARIPNDPFGLDLDIGTFCDFRDHAPMSEACRTFIGAVVEIEKNYVALDPQTRSRLNPACIPPGLKIPQIFEAIRPELRKRVGICAGHCTSTGYVMTSLNAVFPCPAAKP
jgi:hypothetical protein